MKTLSVLLFFSIFASAQNPSSKALGGYVDNLLVQQAAVIDSLEKSVGELLKANKQLTPPELKRSESQHQADLLRKIQIMFLQASLPSDNANSSSVESAESYFRCMALVGGNPGICGNLKRNDTDRWEVQCEMDYYDARTSMGRISQNRGMMTQACEQRNLLVKEQDKSFDDRKLKQVCAAFFEGGKDPDALCSKLAPFLKGGGDRDFLPECIRKMPILMGIGNCADIPRADSHKRNMCLENAAFRKAYAANNIALCGDSPICVVMMGGAAASCQIFAEKALESSCLESARQGREAHGGEMSRCEAGVKETVYNLAPFNDRIGRQIIEFERLRATIERMSDRFEKRGNIKDRKVHEAALVNRYNRIFRKLSLRAATTNLQ